MYEIGITVQAELIDCSPSVFFDSQTRELCRAAISFRALSRLKVFTHKRRVIGKDVSLSPLSVEKVLAGNQT